MSPSEIARTVKLRLASELADDRATLDERARTVEGLLAPAADARDEWMRMLALAFEVERGYTAVEAILTRALRTLDGDVPTGSTSHQDLLRATVAEIEGGRPTLLSREAFAEMAELLKFRHLARHGYEMTPEPARMLDHGERLQRAHASIRATLLALDAWLRA